MSLFETEQTSQDQDLVAPVFFLKSLLNKKGPQGGMIEKIEEIHELSPEVQEELLRVLEQRFAENMVRHEGIHWGDVKRSLEADPAKLWSLQEMEKAGHAPDVFMEDDTAYYFGTCSLKTPTGHRSIAYDEEGEELCRKKYLVECNGNATDIAEVMGIDLMSVEQYQHLLQLGVFDGNNGGTWSWVKTPPHIRQMGFANYGYSKDGPARIEASFASRCSLQGGFRGSLKVSKV